MGREGGRSRSHPDDDRDPCSTWPPKSTCESREEPQDSPFDTGLLVLAWIGFFIPLIWLASPLLSFAEYPLRLGPFVAGVICFVMGLWLFYKSHADLGTNWSITLEVRAQHRLITQGVYRRIRHPMYSALVLYSVGQALCHPEFGSQVRRIWSRSQSCSRFVFVRKSR
jgi:protein-S-isoprenylcysteine O-methyltransferase Ste14